MTDALVNMRVVGYCVRCDRIIERRADGSCPQGHSAAGVTGRVMLDDNEPIPVLPRFNLAAFLIPPIWGPAHGQWAGVIFLPLWLFADSTFRSAGVSIETAVGAGVVAVGTLAAMAWFGKRANGLAWRRRWRTVTVSQFVRQQKRWALAAVPAAAGLAAMALYFDLVVLPGRGL